MFSASKTKGAGGFQIANSLRFRSSASAYLNRTPSVAGNRQTWTWSGWVKRGALGAAQILFGAASSPNGSYFRFESGDTLRFYDYNGSTFSPDLITTQVFRDPSSWYHIVLVSDTTQATSTNRVRMYVNGVQITAFSTATYPAQNAQNTSINNTYPTTIGAASATFDGYLTEINFIDGQALTPSSFGETDAVTGVWKPKRYSGTYGTNGFRLNFSNGTSTTTLGNDSSGNGNNWTTNNISLTAGSTYDWMIDSPTPYPGSSYGVGNYCVLNPLNVVSATISGGNLNSSVGATQGYMVGTIGIPATGKYYFEANPGTASGAQSSIGIQVQSSPPSSIFGANNYTLYLGYGSGTANLYINNNGTSSSANTVTPSATETLSVAYDAATGKLWLGYNNAWKNSSGATDASANPATGTNPTITVAAGLSLVPCHHVYSNTSSANFGQRPFAYTPPSGFKSLCTQNLPNVSIYNGAQYMAATTYTGTGSSRSVANTVNGVSFQPDFTWIKRRDAANAHALHDIVRGATLRLRSNATDAEAVGGLTSINSNGFSVDNDTSYNASAGTYVGWQWKAGGAAVNNTAGSITSQVSANTTAGFSVVTYTGNGAADATVGHGLGIAPYFIIVKNRSTTTDWVVYHQSLPSWDGGNYAHNSLKLNTTGALANIYGLWSNSTSSLFTISDGQTTAGDRPKTNSSGNNYVAYCWAPIAGYSAFGSYTGNGSADGPFVYTGFRPRWVLLKRTDAAADWWIQDTSRSPYNAANALLFPDLSNAEYTTAGVEMDGLSNGFKIRNTNVNNNASGGTYIYAAFAENPLNVSLAR
jgi:hypothetical protein